MKLVPQRDHYRDNLCRRYGLNWRHREILTDAFIAQLEGCMTEEARRLLLGVSEKYPFRLGVLPKCWPVERFPGMG